MPQLKWNEHEIVECLGVLPNYDEEWAQYSFLLDIDKLIFKLIIIDYENLVIISLAQKSSAEPFLNFSILVRGEVRYVNEKNFAFLEFSDCIISTYYDPEFFDKNKYPSYLNFEIHTFPKFSLNFS